MDNVGKKSEEAKPNQANSGLVNSKQIVFIEHNSTNVRLKMVSKTHRTVNQY